MSILFIKFCFIRIILRERKQKCRWKIVTETKYRHNPEWVNASPEVWLWKDTKTSSNYYSVKSQHLPPNIESSVCRGPVLSTWQSFTWPRRYPNLFNISRRVRCRRILPNTNMALNSRASGFDGKRDSFELGGAHISLHHNRH